MDDGDVLAWIRRQSAGAACVFSVCTGALLLGAAGLLNGRTATTHLSALELLPYFGAVATDQRVVVDGRMVFAAGVTAGLDGALRVAADLRGDEIANHPTPHGPRARATIQQRNPRHRTTHRSRPSRRRNTRHLRPTPGNRTTSRAKRSIDLDAIKQDRKEAR